MAKVLELSEKELEELIRLLTQHMEHGWVEKRWPGAMVATGVVSEVLRALYTRLRGGEEVSTEDSDDGICPCPQCGGEGYLVSVIPHFSRSLEAWLPAEEFVGCPVCQGTGQVFCEEEGA